MHPLHGARHMRPCIRYTQQRAFCYSFFRKTFSDFPKPYAEYFHLFAHKQTRKSVIREAKCAHEKKHKPCCKKYKPYILKYKAHILKQVPCIFCLSKCLKNNMVQTPQIGHPHAGNPPSGNEYMHRGMHKNKPPPSPIGNGWGGVPYSCVRVRYQLSR